MKILHGRKPPEAVSSEVTKKNPETNSGFIRKNQEDTRLERNTDTVSNFLIGFHDAAEVLTETILVELLHGLLVPEPAPVRRELIAKEELAVELAELKLEVNKDKAASSKSFLRTSLILRLRAFI